MTYLIHSFKCYAGRKIHPGNIFSSYAFSSWYILLCHQLSFISVPNLCEAEIEERENLWKIEFPNTCPWPYFSSWWHNKRESQKVIVEHTYDDSFAQKRSIQYVSLAVNCSFIVSHVLVQSLRWERQYGLVKRQETLQSVIVWISALLFTIPAMWPPQS